MTASPAADAAGRRYDVLLLDFGGVVIRNPAEMHHVVEDHFGLPRGTFTWRGPLDPDNDALYRESLGPDGITERDYWRIRADEVGRAAGVGLDLMAYMSLSLEADEDEVIRPEAVDVCHRARQAGMGVSVLTNDLRAFHDDDWVDSIGFLQRVDHLIDCSHIGFLKPDRRAYQLALDTLGDVEPGRILFVDDQPRNAAAAEELGIDSLWFDISDAAGSWQRVARRLGV